MASAAGTAGADSISHMATARDGLKQRLETLANDMNALAADKGFAGLLIGMSRLWRYGIFNQVMISWQRPKATSVAGRRQWEKVGRVVRDGEVPTLILAPSKRKAGGCPFIMVKVFDIAQTDGPPAPPLSVFVAPRGDCPQLEAIEKAAVALEIELEQVDEFPTMFGDDTSVLGRAYSNRRVKVRKRLNPLVKARTLVHEYAHVLLLEPYRGASRLRWNHKNRPTSEVCEAEADATAFVVLHALGLPAPSPSFMIWMGASGPLILVSMQRIAAAARAILTAIEGGRPTLRIPRLPVRKVRRRAAGTAGGRKAAFDARKARKKLRREGK